MAMANVAWRGRFDVGNVPRFGYCSAFEVVPKAAIAVAQAQAQAEAEGEAEASPNVLVAAIVRFFLRSFLCKLMNLTSDRHFTCYKEQSEAGDCCIFNAHTVVSR